MEEERRLEKEIAETKKYIKELNKDVEFFKRELAHSKKYLVKLETALKDLKTERLSYELNKMK